MVASGILRSRVIQLSEPMLHVLRASIWPTEGQYVIHFLWDMLKNVDSIKAHLLIPQLVVRGYPMEMLALGTLTQKSPRCLQVGSGFSDVITECASGILAGCLQSCSWARGLLFELVQSPGYVITGWVCEVYIDDLSQFATSSSRTQLLHDAGQIGKETKRRHSQVGTDPVLQIHSPGKRQIAGEVGRRPYGGTGSAHLPGNSRHTPQDRNRSREKKMRIQPAKTHLERQTKGEESQSSVQDEPCFAKAQDDGHSFILFKFMVTRHREPPQHRFNAMCRNLKMDTVMGKTRACTVSTVALFFGSKRVPHVATRVEQVSEWITMWRGFDADTRRRIRKVWREIDPTLANDPRRWSKASGPIAATIRSVLEAG